MSNATPFFSAQGGGHFAWHCVSQTTGLDYSNQLASIQGLSRSAGFAGEIKVPEVTITIAGYGLFAGDGVGSELVLSLTETSSGNSADFGCYIIKNIETTGPIVTIKASGRCGEVIPQDYNAYSVPANNPRNWVANWLMWASNSAVTPAALGYNDNYQRSLTRVAAGAATLKVNGFVKENLTTLARTGSEADTSTWPAGGWQGGRRDPPYLDTQRDLAPEFTNKRAFLGNTPLWWHQRNQTWNVTITARAQTPATSSDHGQFPLGYLQFIYLSIALANGALNNPTLYFSAERSIAPGAQKDVELEFPSALAAANYIAKKRKEARKTGASEGTEYKLQLAKKKVIITNVGQYQGAKMPWYSSARSALAPTAPNPTAPIADCVNLDNVTIRSGSSSVVTFASNAGLSVNNFQYAPQPQNALWQALGITSNANLKPGYQMQQQGLKPVTVNQRFFTRDLMAQAATLGSLGIFEGKSGGTYGPEFCDVCPETGTIYALPLTVSTVVEINMATAYPLPGIISLTFTDAHDEDHNYTYVNSNGQANQSATFAIVQGHTQGWQESSSNRLGLSSADWGQNPGGLCDRWTGSYITNNHLAYTTPTYGAGAFKLLKEDGNLIGLTSGYVSISANNNYTVRDTDGNQYPLFLSAGYVTTDTSVNALTQKSPFLDLFPILQWLQANERVFSDNATRQAFNIKTTLAFASATPGDVVAIQLDKIFNGTKALGLIIGVEVSTDGYCNLEIVPMHKITTDDYTNFTNLGEILP